MTALRAAVVGVGYLGNFHAQKYSQLASSVFKDRMSFVGVCDLNPAQAQKVADSLKVKAFQDVRDLIGHVDLVTIATHSVSHFEIAKQLLQAGIHVNVEKPMSLTAREAEELVAIAELKKLKLAVGQSERYSKVYQEWKSQIGKFSALEFERHAPFNARGSDVSVIHDLMVHDLDLSADLFQFELPKVIWARAGKVLTESWDWAECLMEWSDGRTAIFSASRVSAQMIRKARALTAVGSYLVDFQNGQIDSARMGGQGPGAMTMEVQNQVVGKTDNLLLETEAFIHAVLGNSSDYVSGKQAQQSIQMIEKIEAKLDR